MKKFLFILFFALIIFVLFPHKEYSQENAKLWDIQSIDTMKYSRDPSREKLNDPSFNVIIAKQVSDVAATGATHIAIATPYDSEFLPILKEWVSAARRNNLHVWFRGNLSGWEGWFGYPKIDRKTHIEKTREFILKNPALFEDGDIFSSCPECENGGPGDPRKSGDIDGYRKFLISDYNATENAFNAIGKKVRSNFYSMNADVARLIMDKSTTKALDGVIVIDHYVKSPKDLNDDISEIAQGSGGRVMLGEFGAPIPDIHGNMNEDEQAVWLGDVLGRLALNKDLLGLNYWVNVGGSTRLYNDNGTVRKAVTAISQFYKPAYLILKVTDPLGDSVPTISVASLERKFSGKDGLVLIPFVLSSQEVVVEAPGYVTQKIIISKNSGVYSVILLPKEENLAYQIRAIIKILLRI